ncbi:hypothetical protein DY000_02042418 [Brassica cretica]|uniref:Uncharacterized protein n=1 Tax=Brassica cretica TaxID=69181 RepID=A0ABQ7BJ56_BRACR|nr:hypothetical protein DY000_02042418 [Brassica cretica]
MNWWNARRAPCKDDMAYALSPMNLHCVLQLCRPETTNLTNSCINRDEDMKPPTSPLPYPVINH